MMAMEKTNFVPIPWELLAHRSARPGPARSSAHRVTAPDDFAAFETLMQKSMEDAASKSGPRPDPALVRQWAAQVMSTVQRHLLAAFTQRESGPASPMIDWSTTLALAVRLREASQAREAPQPRKASPKEPGSKESYADIIGRASETYRLPERLIRAVIKAESNFNPKAVSPAGARGLMQLMPATARELGVSDSFDPQGNIMGGSRYLRQLLDRYHGDLRHALAAYNWGPGRVDAKGTSALPAETKSYLKRIAELLRDESV